MNFELLENFKNIKETEKYRYEKFNLTKNSLKEKYLWLINKKS